MINSMRNQRFFPAIILFFCALAACKKEARQSALTPDPSMQADLPAQNPLPKVENNVSIIDEIDGRLNPELKYDSMIKILGEKIPPELMTRIEAEGQSLAEFYDTIGKGGKSYVVGLQDNGGMVLYIADGYPLMFGYAYPALGNPDGGEKHHLNEFKASGKGSVTVMNDNFEEVSMLVEYYKHKINPALQAVAYTKGKNRSLIFFDSSRVEVSKLLPAAPNAVDKETIDRIKAMLKNKAK